MIDWKSPAFRRALCAAGVLLLLGVMLAELALSARRQSQTFDEACHIFAGYRYWKNSDFGINPEHPPLVKLVAALPLLGLTLRTPPIYDDPFKTVGYLAGRQFLYMNDAAAILRSTRMAAAAFTIALGLAVFLIARRMWGTGPAFVALAILVFEPNFLAHGALVTTDVGVTLGLFLAVGCFYLFVKQPGWSRLLAAGLAAGLCLGAKHSGLLIFPILLVLAAVELLVASPPGALRLDSQFARRALRSAAALALIALIAFAVLWSLYGFRYAARPSGLAMNPPLAQYAQRMGTAPAAALLKVARWHLLPEAYLYGVADVLSIGALPTVIFGQYYPAAQWFYFPAIFVVKSTLAFLILSALAAIGGALWARTARREALFLLCPPAVYLGVAMFSGINYGVRHLLPVYPFLIVLAGYGAWKLGERHRLAAAALVALLALHAASSLRAFPNYIPYANELFGGPANAHAVLADSNVDWAQGLVAMKRYIDERHITHCWFAYFGAVVADAAYYGIPCKGLSSSFAELMQLPVPVVPPQVDGPVFISSTEIAGTYWRGELDNPYFSFQRRPPSAVIAGSILVYDGKVDVPEVSALTHEDRAASLLAAQQLAPALAEAEAAVAIAPNRPAAHVARGNVLAALGRTAEAREENLKAQRIAYGVLSAGK